MYLSEKINFACLQGDNSNAGFGKALTINLLCFYKQNVSTVYYYFDFITEL